MPLPSRKSPRKQRKRKRVKSRILTKTPERAAIKNVQIEKIKKNQKTARAKRKILKRKPQKKIKKKPVVESSSSSEDDEPIPFDDSSDADFESDQSKDESSSQKNLAQGDFVVVKFGTKATIHHYIGLIDDIGASDEEPEARFLHRIPSANANRPTFAFRDDDEGAFPRCDIVKILLKPHQAGGTTRRQTQFVFPCSLSEFNII